MKATASTRTLTLFFIFLMIVVRRSFSTLQMNKKPLAIVVALDDQNGIGRNDTLPWRIKNDLKFFRYVTSKRNDESKQNAVIVGRKTYETFPKPLPNRLNIVVSKNAALPNTSYPNVVRVGTFDDAVHRATDDANVENVFVIGGVSIYEAAMKTNLVNRVFATRVEGDFNCTAVWSSFDVSNFNRTEPIADEYQQFFNHSDESQDENEKEPAHHLELYERDI